MKKVLICQLVVILLASIPAARALFANEKPSVEMGMRLFNSPSLGGVTSTKSCASCHPAGAGLENAWKNPDLAMQVNTCIAGPLKGLKRNVNSVEMQSLIMYIRSLKQ